MRSRLEFYLCVTQSIIMTPKSRSASLGRRGGNCSWATFGALLLFAAVGPAAPAVDEFRGIQFIGFTGLSGFSASVIHTPPECVLVSSPIQAGILWDELIPSWNMVAGSSAGLKVEVRPVIENGESRFYTLGLWSASTNAYPRRSVANQSDPYGTVETDTLILKQRCRGLQLRLTLSGTTNSGELKFLGVCVRDSFSIPAPQQPCLAAWGKLIPVPERSQMDYPNGEELCSPATLSMLMGFWAQKLQRPDLDRHVPEIQTAIYDETWKGTGNWAFNTAYAGSFPGIRAYVTRFSDLTELEEWVACGLPVGLSVCYNKLRGKPGGRSGHLVVCVGFTKAGDPIINDPGTRLGVRKIFPRKNLIDAWAHSHNMVYLVYPEDTRLPKDRFDHWSVRP